MKEEITKNNSGIKLNLAEENVGKTNVIDYAINFLEKENAAAYSIRLIGSKADLKSAREKLDKINLRDITCPPLMLIDDSAGLRAQIYAAQNEKIKSLFFDGQFIGKELEDEYARYIMLHILPDKPNENNYKQAENLFEKSDKILKNFGSSFRDVIRTWLYADKILDWYSELNLARNKFFEKNKIYEHLVPASTGIGIPNLSGAAIASQVLAVIPKNGSVKIEKANSPLQNPALNYKSSFSRGIKLEVKNDREIFISGTASINKKGETVFLDDTRKQIEMTMDVVSAILADANMDWENVTNALVYFKNKDEFNLFDEYCSEKKISIPHIKINADICRDNLLFEIEAEAFA